MKEGLLLLKDSLEACKYMTSIAKNFYIDKLDDLVNKYNKTYLGSIKMKPVNVKTNTYIDSSRDINKS